MAKVSSRCFPYFPAAMLVKQYDGAILGSLNLGKKNILTNIICLDLFSTVFINPDIDEVWENTETLNLEKCGLYLCPITLQILEFIHGIGFVA